MDGGTCIIPPPFHLALDRIHLTKGSNYVFLLSCVHLRSLLVFSMPTFSSIVTLFPTHKARTFLALKLVWVGFWTQGFLVTLFPFVFGMFWLLHHICFGSLSIRPLHKFISTYRFLFDSNMLLDLLQRIILIFMKDSFPIALPSWW